MEEKLLTVMDFGELNGFLDTILNGETIRLEDLLEEIMSGDFSSFTGMLEKYLRQVFVGNLEQCRDLFLAVMLFGIFAIILSSLSELFSNNRIALFSRYFVFLMISLLLLKSFAVTYEMARTLLEEMGDFIGALMPVFCIALGLANGSVTAAGHYELQLLLLLLVQKVLLAILLPLVQLYCMLHVMDQLQENSRFGGVLSFVKKFILFTTKASLFASIGGSILQTAIMPAVDGMKNQVLLKTVSLFPGLGDYANVIGEFILQGALLIKNSVGVIGILILILLCMKPVVVTCMYGTIIRCASALLQLSGEKKMTGHIWKMADSFFLLARIQLFGGGIFFVSIAAATVAFYRR
jgi:stage III sporulation protein AE